MKKITIAQVDAFTAELFGGNPAGVVLDANKLTDIEMQKIAREMNLSETAFVLNSTNAHFKLRYFTPVSEIKFCGHATIATLYALAANNSFGMHKRAEYNFDVETGAGVLKMTVNKDRMTTISFYSPKILIRQADITHAQLASGLNVSASIFDTSKPLMIEDTNSYLYAVVKNLTVLGEISYDYQRAKEFSNKHNIVLFCLLTQETFDKNNHIHSRVFAPKIGLVEDPVTGSTQGGLAGYLLKNKMIHFETKVICSEQGHFVKRPGSLKVEIDTADGEVKARIVAQAVMVFQTEISLM